MTHKLSYVVFDTPAGWMGILRSPHGLLRTSLPQSSPEEALRSLGAETVEATSYPEIFRGLAERFRLYFSGKRVAFPDRLDTSTGTSFQWLVWETARHITYGETRSYSWIAQQMGKPKAMRAVGQALGRNPLPIIIPCHRVLASDGGLGGFTGGLDVKMQLLRMEGSIA